MPGRSWIIESAMPWIWVCGNQTKSQNQYIMNNNSQQLYAAESVYTKQRLLMVVEAMMCNDKLRMLASKSYDGFIARYCERSVS